nr:MAG TPA: hypothetical protein [Caudoviricetes sp.]
MCKEKRPETSLLQHGFTALNRTFSQNKSAVLIRKSIGTARFFSNLIAFWGDFAPLPGIPPL